MRSAILSSKASTSRSPGSHSASKKALGISSNSCSAFFRAASRHWTWSDTTLSFLRGTSTWETRLSKCELTPATRRFSSRRIVLDASSWNFRKLLGDTCSLSQLKPRMNSAMSTTPFLSWSSQLKTSVSSSVVTWVNSMRSLERLVQRSMVSNSSRVMVPEPSLSTLQKKSCSFSPAMLRRTWSRFFSSRCIASFTAIIFSLTTPVMTASSAQAMRM
mmetsp:Transcript_46972/g.94856  ORF Transcript_46972/g.94856 Transcript_46972/m.94856 type:complete len:217 (-) Transcript_46972:812-1462(-)